MAHGHAYPMGSVAARGGAKTREYQIS